MAREPVVAMDFLGLGRDSELNAEKERGKLVKPTASIPTAPVQSSARGLAFDEERETSRPRLMLGKDASLLDGPLAFSLAQGMPWASMAGKSEETDRSGLGGLATLEKSVEDKPLEELTDADITQFSGEECRRYMMRIMKGREAPRVAANKPLMPFRGRIEARQEEVKPSSKRGGSVIKNGLSEASTLSAQHDFAEPSSNSTGCRSAFQAPRYNLQSQASCGEEVHGRGRISERAVHMPEPNLSLAIPLSREQPRAQSSGFGSPLPTFLRMLKPPEHSQRPSQPEVHQSGQGCIAQVGAVARSTGQSHLPGRPPTAQLTIFYSGTVNVYDDVPADKAQAIMLLAGSGSSWSSSIMNPPPSVSVRPPSLGAMASSSNSPAQSGAAPAVAEVSQAGPVTSPLVPTISIAPGLKQGAGRPTLHAELPQARKASLARFLEKRKDRARGKAPYVTPVLSLKRDVGSSTPPREKSPNPTSKGMICIRSTSPVSTVPGMLRNQLPSPAQRPGLPQPGCLETCPTGLSPTPQQVPEPSSSEDRTSTTAAQRPSKEDCVDWRSQQHSHVSSQVQKLERLEEDSGSPSQWH